jgi:DNA (cytosine-5)-methyltransferase 1
VPVLDAGSMRVLELFAGCGGASLGLERAGFEALACIERDPWAAATLAAAGLPAVHADVREVDYRPFAGRTDLLWASPPCQAGSTAGKRLGAYDDRNGWPWTWDVIDAVQPTWFLAENVLGWTYHRHGCDRQGRDLSCIGCYWSNIILPSLRERFAFVGVWTMNAADYGAPQSRRRVVLWGGPLPLVETPPPSHGDPEAGVLPDGVEPWVSVEDVVGETLHRGSCTTRRCYPCDGSHGRACTEPLRRMRPSPTLTTTEVKGTRASAVTGWSFNGGPDRASDAAFLIAGIRRISIEEAMTLQGFPADWPLQGNSEAQYRQVGNAVPPVLSEAAGRVVAFAESVRSSLPRRDIEALGTLLALRGETVPAGAPRAA